MSVLTQQRDAGQSEWWAELFALQLGFLYATGSL